jgi:MFS family permease
MRRPGAVDGWLRAVPPGVWTLGLVSLLMDTSSEAIHALLPIYLVGSLGASALTVGIIEGIAEATASITRIFSGLLSDWFRNRKFLAALGYGLAAFTKPVFALATSIGWVVTARFVDRVGKGIRGAPRDALIADITPPDRRGASFGLRQALDTIGAFLGPLTAIVVMLATNSITTVFWVAVIPAFASFALIAFAVREPERPPQQGRGRTPLTLAGLRQLGPAFWQVVAVAAVFTLARFSEAFLILRAQSVGLPIALVPAVMVLMNIVYAAAAYPAGILSDRAGRYGLLAAGFALLIAADLFLGLAGGIVAVGIGVALWGLHMGLTQGLLAALVADTAPADLRGTAFGMFNLITGVALLAASAIAGALWDRIGPAGTFLAGAAFTLVALAGTAILRYGSAGTRGGTDRAGCSP